MYFSSLCGLFLYYLLSLTLLFLDCLFFYECLYAFSFFSSASNCILKHYCICSEVFSLWTWLSAVCSLLWPCEPNLKLLGCHHMGPLNIWHADFWLHPSWFCVSLTSWQWALGPELVNPSQPWECCVLLQQMFIPSVGCSRFVSAGWAFYSYIFWEPNCIFYFFGCIFRAFSVNSKTVIVVYFAEFSFIFLEYWIGTLNHVILMQIVKF